MNWRYTLGRIGQVPFMLATVLVVTFFVIHFVPGDPAANAAGESASPEQVAKLRQEMNLDRALPMQMLLYGSRAVQGDLGYSHHHGRTVVTVIADLIPPTLLLTGSALVVSTFGGVLLALAAARRPFGLLDRTVNGVMLIGYAIPGFWLAQLAIIYLVLKLNIFPLQGYSDFGPRQSLLTHLWDVIRHLALPCLVLAVAEVAAVTRVVRSGLLTERGKGYARTADSKGLTPAHVIKRHLLRNALLPMVTLIGTRVGFLISGAVIVETIFVWPGLGTVLVGAAETGDRPMMIGLTVAVSAMIIVANLLTDLMYQWVDPRIRYD